MPEGMSVIVTPARLVLRDANGTEVRSQLDDGLGAQVHILLERLGAGLWVHLEFHGHGAGRMVIRQARPHALLLRFGTIGPSAAGDTHEDDFLHGRAQPGVEFEGVPVEVNNLVWIRGVEGVSQACPPWRWLGTRGS